MLIKFMQNFEFKNLSLEITRGNGYINGKLQFTSNVSYLADNVSDIFSDMTNHPFPKIDKTVCRDPKMGFDYVIYDAHFLVDGIGCTKEKE